MAKVSPMIRSFNAGEFSALVEGRPDLERYPSSMRRLFNCVAAPQGPAIGRSGTAFVCPVYDHEFKSAIIPFVFSETQSILLEFTTGRIRFITEAGLQVYAANAATVVSTSPLVVNVPGLTTPVVGDEFVLGGFDETHNLNSETARITAKAGTHYTLNVNAPAETVALAVSVQFVYAIACSYTEEQRMVINAIQSVDVIYLLTGEVPRKLSRYGAYDWRLTDVKFLDGPYMPINDKATVLTPSATGNIVPNMASNTQAGFVASANTNKPAVASGGTFLGRTQSYGTPASQAYYAFNADDTYWAANFEQRGDVQIQLPVAKSVDGYALFVARDNQDSDFIAKDYAPSSFTFEGSNDNAVWFILDKQEDYVLYDNAKSIFFEIANPTPYLYYRLNVQKLVRNGMIEPRVRRLVMRATDTMTFNLTASSTVGINYDTGFKATDVGRLVRLRGSDGAWRAVRISAYVSATVVTVTLEGEPLPDTQPIKNWRLGYWSDTTGWPICGDFFDDRLWLAGPQDTPDMFAGSMVGLYETFSQTDASGVVLDENAIVARLNAKKLSRIYWLESDEKGLLFGTGSAEYLLSSAKGEAEDITARSIKARSSTSRGSARVPSVKIDRQVIFVQRSGRTLREMAYAYEADGYKSPSMSQLASHITAKGIAEIDYASEPYSIIWCRLKDGTLAGLTYNRDESVVGWHQHDLSGIVENIAVMPQVDGLQDGLWLEIRRTINGQEKRYIERLTRFWDFEMTVLDAHYVDSALSYIGEDEATMLYGLQHLEGREVYGLGDGIPFGPKTVTNGTIELDLAATNIIVGLGFDAEGETSRLDNGAADGTAFGKTKRIHQITIGVWDSYGGEVGTWNPNELDPITQKPGTIKYVPVEYPDGRGDEIEGIVLYTGETNPLTPEAGYEKKGSLAFRRPRSSPLPFNITYIAPQMVTQDGG